MPSERARERSIPLSGVTGFFDSCKSDVCAVVSRFAACPNTFLPRREVEVVIYVVQAHSPSAPKEIFSGMAQPAA